MGRAGRQLRCLLPRGAGIHGFRGDDADDLAVAPYVAFSHSDQDLHQRPLPKQLKRVRVGMELRLQGDGPRVVNVYSEDTP
jgi:hypothetical protein